MTITKKITTVQEVPVEVPLPYYSKQNNCYRMFAENYKGELFGLEVYDWKDSFNITNSVKENDIQWGEPITAEQFWHAFNVVKLRLLQMEAHSRDASYPTPFLLDGEVEEVYQTVKTS